MVALQRGTWRTSRRLTHGRSDSIYDSSAVQSIVPPLDPTMAGGAPNVQGEELHLVPIIPDDSNPLDRHSVDFHPS
jgi:hypothetical protein